MKTPYEKPEMYVVEMASGTLFATSNNFTIDAQSRGEWEEDFTTGRRGRWGDLWESNDKG